MILMLSPSDALALVWAGPLRPEGLAGPYWRRRDLRGATDAVDVAHHANALYCGSCAQRSSSSKYVNSFKAAVWRSSQIICRTRSHTASDLPPMN